jgi:uncharacterized membrane protein
MLSMGDPHMPSVLTRIARAGYAVLASFAFVGFTLALGTDLLYWQTSNLMWLEFSAWLLLVGIVTGVAAVPFGAIEFFSRDWEARTETAAWLHVVGRIVVLILAFFNNLVHAADGWTAIMPWGLTLSALTVLVMLAVTCLDASPVHAPHFRRRSHV